jgi:ubiquinone/menaquinone biosynthesis C-methylase UbiE
MSKIFQTLNDVQQFIDNRVVEYGGAIQSSGWSSVESQYLRFDYLCRDFDLNGKSILDVGCGKGDLVTYLRGNEVNFSHYTGIDIAYKMITHCNDTIKDQRTSFRQGTIFDIPVKSVDVALLSGALSYRYDNAVIDAKATLKTLFTICTTGVALNFLSKKVDYELNKNQHYSPSTILEWALELSSNVTLYHDYPLYEFTIVVKK